LSPVHAGQATEVDGADVGGAPMSETLAHVLVPEAGAVVPLRIAAIENREVDLQAVGEHIDEDGATVFEHACRFGFHGIVIEAAHRALSVRPSRDWIKVKSPDSLAMIRHSEGRWEK
jgi:hypothetical protein